MLYFLALPKESGGRLVVNDRRAAVISLPGETNPEDALDTARTLVLAQDPGNPGWAGATGGFLSDDSLSPANGFPNGLFWLNAAGETPEELTGDPGGGPAPLDPDQAIVEDGDTLTLLGEDVAVAVAENTPSLSVAGTLALVEHGDTLSVDGGTVILSVAGNEVTAVYDPE